MSDFFKVVYIKELKEVEPVPCLWEENGILYWPASKKEVRQNQSNAKSIPHKNAWIKYTCEVKRSNILLFSHASATADRICEDSSTEEERDEIIQHQTKRKRATNKPPCNDSNYYEFCFNNNDNNPGTSKSNLLNTVQPEMESDEDTNSSVEIQNEKTVVASDQASDSVFEILIPNSQISTEFEKLYVFLNKLEKNIDLKFAEIAIKLDHIDKRLRECEVPPEKDQDTNMLFPLNDIHNVQELEQKLNIAEYKAKIFGHLRRVNGTGLFWKSACYKLCGFLFTKTLLTNYSWTGLSRTTAAKESFNKLGNILDLFYKVVQYSDNSFNYSQRDSFFRDGVLKHSITRLNGPKRKTLLQGKENIEIREEEQQGQTEENDNTDMD